MDPKEEGWCTDPYDRHEQRWFSDGKPTKLVRDKDVTSYDPPPGSPPNHLPQEIDTPSNGGPADLRRADDAERAPEMDRGEIYMRQMDVTWSSGAPSDWITRYQRSKWWRSWLPWVPKQ
jgi:hypothetical protein